MFLYFGTRPGPGDHAGLVSQGTNAAGAAAATTGSRFGSSAGDGGRRGRRRHRRRHHRPEQLEQRPGGRGPGLRLPRLGPPAWPRRPTGWWRATSSGPPMGAVSGAGDIDGNGFDDVIVGAPAAAGPGAASCCTGAARRGLAPTASDTRSRRWAPTSARWWRRPATSTATAATTSWWRRPPRRQRPGRRLRLSGSRPTAPSRPGSSGGGAERPRPARRARGSPRSPGWVTSTATATPTWPSARRTRTTAQADEGVVFVFKGAAAGLSATCRPSSRATSPAPPSAPRVAGPGDVNGDGHADLAIGAPGLDNGGNANAGAVFLIPGSARGPATTNASLADNVLRGGQANQNLGSALGAAGDVNNDGYADVIAGSAGADDGQTDEGRAHLYLGSANTNGLRRAATWRIESNSAGAAPGPGGRGRGRRQRRRVRRHGAGRARTSAGPTTAGCSSISAGTAGPDTTADGTLVGPAGAGFGKAVARAGDVNGGRLRRPPGGRAQLLRRAVRGGAAVLVPGRGRRHHRRHRAGHLRQQRRRGLAGHGGGRLGRQRRRPARRAGGRARAGQRPARRGTRVPAARQPGRAWSPPPGHRGERRGQRPLRRLGGGGGRRQPRRLRGRRRGRARLQRRSPARGASTSTAARPPAWPRPSSGRATRIRRRARHRRSTPPETSTSTASPTSRPARPAPTAARARCTSRKASAGGIVEVPYSYASSVVGGPPGRLGGRWPRPGPRRPSSDVVVGAPGLQQRRGQRGRGLRLPVGRNAPAGRGLADHRGGRGRPGARQRGGRGRRRQRRRGERRADRRARRSPAARRARAGPCCTSATRTAGPSGCGRCGPASATVVQPGNVVPASLNAVRHRDPGQRPAGDHQRPLETEVKAARHALRRRRDGDRPGLHQQRARRASPSPAA